MKIEKLIDVFEKLLPIYEKAYKERLVPYSLSFGLCNAADDYFDTDISDVMDRFDGYYKNFIKVKGRLFDFYCYLYKRPKTYRGLKPRIDFMKSEIKSLKRLQKKGYTHV